MEIKIESNNSDGDVRRLRLTGRLVQSELARQSEAVEQSLAVGGKPRAVLLDLSDADFIDSSGLSWLLVWHKRHRAAGGRLILHSLPSLVMDVVKMMRLDLVLDLADDEDAALAMARGGDHDNEGE